MLHIMGGEVVTGEEQSAADFDRYGDYKVILGGPGVLEGFITAAEYAGDYLKAQSLKEEWDSIHEALREAIGDERIVISAVGKNRLRGGRVCTEPLAWESNVGAVTLNQLGLMDRGWPRGTLNVIADKVFVKPDGVWNSYPENTILSYLADAGMTINTIGSKLIFTNPKVSELAKSEIDDLAENGYTFVEVPFVDATEQKFPFHPDDIDGHIRQVFDAKRRIHVLVDEKYALQTNGLNRLLKESTEKNGYIYHLVNMTDDVPLALNFLQLPDGTIVKSKKMRSLVKRPPKDKSRADLDSILNNLRVPIIRTATPIVEIPIATQGSIGCLTNIFPADVLVS